MLQVKVFAACNFAEMLYVAVFAACEELAKRQEYCVPECLEPSKKVARRQKCFAVQTVEPPDRQ